MARRIDFYFDFSSPYAYFAALEINVLGKKHDCEVRWHPILLGAVFKTTGAKPLLQMPLKGAYAQHDLERTARMKGLPFCLPASVPFVSLAASRLFYWIAEEQDVALAQSFARNVFKAGYQMGMDISAPVVISDIAVALGVSRDQVEEALTSPVVKTRLREEVTAAEEQGVFGSPFFLVEGEAFWGYDRLQMLDDWLSRGGW
ncbi:2-hydroxychromene-2-carboxylate isomerase [Kiloniella laminariae]|uniref:2-hydroxychromene-2-carboxylate isomerase n=1 Tax=Kiloniella laminariae TaxID=454162 RepID=A0ABT4LSQ8_9PROT|nr:2-hydroxychromene-2-carboxylate isomerase [Kiloniella laminariae]MCZ4282972.1 2-hydroxychromene-2-carboxylate isomerase [Kiloniella laminariae]